MEHLTGKESIVSRLFGFGRKRRPGEAHEGKAAETGFARTDAPAPDDSDDSDDSDGGPSITVPEQVIRVRPGRKDNVIQAIGDSFRELTSLLGNVSDRLDRQDGRSADLSDQLREIPDYLQTLPRLHEEQNQALRSVSESIARGNELQSQTLHVLTERMNEGTEAVQDVSRAMTRIPDELRQHAEAQEEAIRKVAAAQHQTAKVLHVGNQKSLQLFHQATQRTLQTVQKNNREQQRHMQQLLDASAANMKRMFVLAAAFVGAALIAVAGLIMFR